MKFAPSFLQLKAAIFAFLSFVSATSAVDIIQISVKSVNLNVLYISLYEYILFEVFADLHFLAG